MKMKLCTKWRFIVIVCIGSFVTCTSSQEKISFLAGRIYINSQLNLVVDGTIKINKYFDDLNFLIPEKGYLIKNYCPKKDSISVYLKINKKDTTFFVRPHDIKAVYLSHDVYGGREVLEVKFIYRQSSADYQARPGELILEDPL